MRLRELILSQTSISAAYPTAFDNRRLDHEAMIDALFIFSAHRMAVVTPRRMTSANQEFLTYSAWPIDAQTRHVSLGQQGQLSTDNSFARPTWSNGSALLRTVQGKGRTGQSSYPFVAITSFARRSLARSYVRQAADSVQPIHALAPAATGTSDGSICPANYTPAERSWTKRGGNPALFPRSRSLKAASLFGLTTALLTSVNSASEPQKCAPMETTTGHIAISIAAQPPSAIMDVSLTHRIRI